MGASASFGRRHESQSDLNRPRACSARHLALAATAVAACFFSGPSWCTGSTSSARLPPKQRIALKAVKLRLDPPEIGQPQVPDLPTQQLERIATSPPEQLPPALQRTHMQALQKVLRGLRLNLHRLSAILPTGLGDGTLGSRAVKELFRTTKMRPFRAVVLMPKVTLLEAEARYKAVAGAGLLVMRLEASDAGTDKVVKALSTSQGLLLVGAYEDAIYFVRGFRRVKAQLVNLLICEMAHAALADSKAAHRVVLEWEKAFRVDVLQSLYISSQSLEPNPVKGFEEATMQVPGVPSYEVVARRGGPGGPEVFSVDLEEAQRQGITVPLKLVVLPATGQGMIEGLAGLHHSLGIEIVKAIPEAAGGGKAEAVEFLNEQVQSLTQGRCKVWSEEPIQQAVPDALLVTGSKLDPMFLLQAVERVAFKARGKTAGYIIILGGLGPAPTAAWRALSAHDPRLKVALQQAAVVRGRLGRALTWQDLPSVLQEAVVSTTSGEEKVSRSWLLKAVDDAIMKAADRWDLMYGHLLAYRESMEDPLQPVPLKAEIHGVQVGMWVAQQFLEWRSGTLSAHRRELLAERGLDVEEEDARSFAEGLAEFEQHLKDSGGNSYVPPAYFTSSGFPLAAWATKQRASWRRGRLSVERQYMLDAVGFPPVAHPDDRATREVTRLVEAVLRNGQLFPQKRRNHIFTVLLRKYHPDSMARMTKERAEEAAEVTQFLAGYREWFLNPPPPPLKAEDVAKLTGFEDDERDSKA